MLADILSQYRVYFYKKKNKKEDNQSKVAKDLTSHTKIGNTCTTKKIFSKGYLKS